MNNSNVSVSKSN